MSLTSTQVAFLLDELIPQSNPIMSLKALEKVHFKNLKYRSPKLQPLMEYMFRKRLVRFQPHYLKAET